MIHVDIIDGRFSPDMHLGIGTVKSLRKCTDLIFDVHLMAVDNKPYIVLLIDAGADRICFHTEYVRRPNILFRKIKAANVKCGIAISPETTVDSLKHLLPLCDFVLIMRIDPGFAHLEGQCVYNFTDDKIVEIREKYPNLEIEVDGRVGFDETERLLKLGCNTFVSGSKGFFSKENKKMENFKKLKKILKENS